MLLLTIITPILLSVTVALRCQLTGVPPEDAHSTGLVPWRTENVPSSVPPHQPASLQGASDGLRVQCSVL